MSQLFGFLIKPGGSSAVGGSFAAVTSTCTSAWTTVTAAGNSPNWRLVPFLLGRSGVGCRDHWVIPVNRCVVHVSGVCDFSTLPSLFSNCPQVENVTQQLWNILKPPFFFLFSVSLVFLAICFSSPCIFKSINPLMLPTLTTYFFHPSFLLICLLFLSMRLFP